MRMEVAAAVLVALAVCGPRAQDVAATADREAAVQRAWRLLTTALESGSLDEQRVAIVALARTGTPRALSLVESIARTGSPSTRRVALAGLPDQPSYLPLLTEGFKDQDNETRLVVVRKLARMRDPRSVSLLQDILLAGDPALFEAAVSSLGALAPLSLPALLQCLGACNELPRQRAAGTLYTTVLPLWGQTAGANLEALRRLPAEPVLVRSLDDRNKDVRLSAAFVLARLGSTAGVDELVRATTDARSGTVQSKYFAMAALNALGRPGYVAPLAAGLSDVERAVRSDAAFAMLAFSHPSFYAAALPVWRATSDLSAFIVLQSLGGSTDRALLRDALANKEPAVRFRAAEALLTLGPDSPSLDVLERLVREDDLALRQPALALLAAKGSPQRAAAVARALLPGSDRPWVRRHSIGTYDEDPGLVLIKSLGAVRDGASVPVLSGLLGKDDQIDGDLVPALVAIGDAAAGQALVQAMDKLSGTVRMLAAGGVISLYDR